MYVRNNFNHNVRYGRECLILLISSFIRLQRRRKQDSPLFLCLHAGRMLKGSHSLDRWFDEDMEEEELRLLQMQIWELDEKKRAKATQTALVTCVTIAGAIIGGQSIQRPPRRRHPTCTNVSDRFGPQF